MTKQVCISCNREVHPEDIDLDGFCRFCHDPKTASEMLGKILDQMEDNEAEE